MVEKILTIIIPTYNMEKYLNHCLSSLIVPDEKLMNQLEVLVIIDGATDHSAEIAYNFQNKYCNTFIVVEKENGNYGSCINRGLKEAKGKYIRILDADDSFDTSFFELYLKRLKTIDTDLVLTPYHYVNEKGEKINSVFYRLPDNNNLTFKEVTPALLKQSIQMHATTYKTAVVRSINYVQTEGISYTDQEWVFTPLSAVNSISYFNYPIYLYLYGRIGQTMNEDMLKRNISHNIICAKKILADYVSFPKFDEDKQKIIDYKAYNTLESPYYSYLVKYTDLDRENLYKYDRFVKSISEDLYFLVDTFTIRYTFCHYIKKWHLDNNYKLNIFIKIISEFCTRIHIYPQRLWHKCFLVIGNHWNILF